MKRWTIPRGTTVAEDPAGEWYSAADVDARLEAANAFIVRRPCYCRGLGDGDGIKCGRSEDPQGPSIWLGPLPPPPKHFNQE